MNTVPDVKQEELHRFDMEKSISQKTFRNYHVVHSSGSTGKPGYFIYDEAAWNQMLPGIIRGALWGMSMTHIVRMLMGKPRIVYIAATDGRYGGAMAAGDGIDSVGTRQMYLDINTPLAQWVNRIQSEDTGFLKTIGFTTKKLQKIQMLLYLVPVFFGIVSGGFWQKAVFGSLLCCSAFGIFCFFDRAYGFVAWPGRQRFNGRIQSGRPAYCGTDDGEGFQ